MATAVIFHPILPLLTEQEIVSIGNTVAWRLGYSRLEAERLGPAWYQQQPLADFCALSSAEDLRRYVLAACDAYQAGAQAYCPPAFGSLRITEFVASSAPVVPSPIPGTTPVTVPTVAPPTVPVVAMPAEVVVGGIAYRVSAGNSLAGVMSRQPRQNVDAGKQAHADEAEAYVRMLYAPLRRLGLGWGDLLLTCLVPLAEFWDALVDGWTMFRAEPLPTLVHWSARAAVRLGLVRLARKVVQCG